MNAMSGKFEIDIDLPEKFEQLFSPKRFKVMFGGRDGSKSWSIARALLIKATEKTLRIGCFREIQKSIKESVHTLLKTQIELMGLGQFWEVQETRVFNKLNGSEFVFAGLRTLNVENIKSFEGLDVAWVEEARNVTKKSWEILIPTIRKPGSEIWVAFNPELDTDETYVRFVKRADDDVMLIPISWRDNPWRSEVLDSDRRKMERDDPDGYLTIYEGQCRQYLDGAIYAKELREAASEGRITRVPYEPLRPVHTFWDLGYSDATAIWFVQSVGFEFRVIDYLEGTSEKLEYYIQEIVKRPYLWGTDWLPHDARAKTLQTGMSTEDLVRKAGRTVKITPSDTVVNGINAARTIFGKCWFDEEKTRDGLNRLRRYAFEIDEAGQRSKLPLHDENSHGSDAWRYFAIASNSVTRDGTKRKFSVTDVAVN
jgi:phage terminase large subunit